MHKGPKDDDADLDLSLYPEGTSIDDDGRLMLGGCLVSEVAARFGTPALIVDESALRSHARTYLQAFTDRHRASNVLFASKSFPTPSIVGLLAEEGCGVDVASGEELIIATSSGADPGTMVMHGNAKSDFDIKSALDAEVGYIVIDNLDDVERIVRLATRKVPVLLRVSPQVDASTHEKMMTGHDASKFGIPSSQVQDAIQRVRREPLLDLQGLHAHIGSGIADLDQFDAEVRALAQMEHFPVYNFGGGLGVRYVSSDKVPSVAEYADVLISAVHEHLGHDVQIMVEPGRSMVARSPPALLTGRARLKCAMS
jgi:diaminopimelate decarboxylase